MKKLLIIILFFNQVVCFGQTEKEYFDRAFSNLRERDLRGAIQEFNNAFTKTQIMCRLIFLGLRLRVG